MTTTPYNCPNCNSTRFIQTLTQPELVIVDESNNPEEIRPLDRLEILQVTCKRCGTQTT